MNFFAHLNARKILLWAVLPAVLVFFIDRVTKNWALHAHVSAIVMNPGLVFGMFSDVLPFARIVFVLTSFGFFFFLFILLIVFFFETLPWLSLWLSVFLSSIAANAFDRLKYGAVVDFINIPFGPLASGYFNLADVFQWIAMFGILYALLLHHDRIWPSVNARNRILIDFGFQLGSALKMVFVCFAAALTIGIFSLSYLFTILQSGAALDSLRLKNFVTAYVICFVAILFLFLLMTFIFGVYISHRSVGPVFAFRRFLEEYLKGSATKFRLRKNDHFKTFEEISDKLLERQKNKK